MLDPLQGGGRFDPQIAEIPAFSNMMKTRWSKYVPVGEVCGTITGCDLVSWERKFVSAIGRIAATSPRVMTMDSSRVARLGCLFGALIRKITGSLSRTNLDIFDRTLKDRFLAS